MSPDKITLSHHWSRRELLKLAGFVGVTAGSPLLLSACGGEQGGGQAGGTRALRVQLDWLKTVQFAGIFYALDSGLYREADLQPTVSAKAGSSDPISIIASGSAQIGLTSVGGEAILAHARGLPIRVLGAKYQKSPSALVSLADKGIRTAADLVGKRIGIQQSARTSIETILDLNDIPVEDVQLITVGSDPTVLVNDQVDVLTSFATNQPLILEAKGHKANVMLYNDLGYEQYAGIFLAHADQVDEIRDVLTRFLSATRKGWTYALDHPDEVAKLVVDKYGESLELEQQTNELAAQAPLIRSELTKEKGLFSMSKDVWQVTNDIMVRSGQIDEPVVIEDLVDFEVLDSSASS